jgi:pyruvate-formate lyase
MDASRHVSPETWKKIASSIGRRVRAASPAATAEEAVRVVYSGIAAVDRNAASQWIRVCKLAAEQFEALSA